ncbi:hypothetical protein ACMFMG_008121 [Clarireedia jacksonii]
MTNTLKHSVPMVANSPIRFECTYYTTLRLPGNPPMGTVDVLIGRVVGVYIAESVLTNGLIDLRKVQPVARCGYHSYTVVRETFETGPPGDGKMAYGLEGSTETNREEQAKREKKGLDAGNVEDLEVRV